MWKMFLAFPISTTGRCLENGLLLNLIFFPSESLRCKKERKGMLDATTGLFCLPTLKVDTAIAEETRNSVQAEEIKANEKARKAQAIADDAQKDLDEALPALDAALASLRNLNKNDVTEVGNWFLLAIMLTSFSIVFLGPSGVFEPSLCTFWWSHARK